jgi:nucleoside-triphosphatase THEP1
MSPNIVILTGERGIGKTSVCRKVIALAQAKGHTCGGVLTPSYPNDARDLLDAHNGDARRLTLESDADPAVIQGCFRFDPQTLAWGNDVLARATPCHLLVVDELGPLEIEREEGLRRAFDALRGGDFALAIVVVRPELVVKAQVRLPTSATAVLTVTHHDRDDIPAMLLETLETEIGSMPEV